MERGKGSDAQVVQAAEAQVQEWRARQSLYLPNFPQEKIEELLGTVDYPPLGSPFAAGRT